MLVVSDGFLGLFFGFFVGFWVWVRGRTGFGERALGRARGGLGEG